jgi:hypothetical protein
MIKEQPDPERALPPVPQADPYAQRQLSRRQVGESTGVGAVLSLGSTILCTVTQAFDHPEHGLVGPHT